MPINLAQCMIDRTAMVTGLDDAIFTTHWSWTSAFDTTLRAGVTADLKTFWNSVSNVCDSSHVLREVRWYNVPATAPYHPVYAETQVITPPPGVPGSGAGTIMPPQCAMTVTLKTASRKHWGRFYLPLTAAASMDTTNKGAIKTSVCDSVAAAAQVLATNPSAPELVVWSPALGTAETITFVQCDNVVDIQRRRRVKKATYKKTLAG